MTAHGAGARSASSPVPHGVLPPAAYEGATSAWRLLEEALLRFAERGYHGVSVRDVTGPVGVRAQSFYAHFASKEDLLYRLIDLGHSAHLAAVEDVLLAVDQSATEQLRAAVAAHVQFHIDYPLVAIVGNNELHALSAPRQAELFERRRQLGGLFIAIIERGIANGEFGCEEPWIPFSAIAGMVLRLGWWYRTPQLADLASTRDDYPRETLRHLQPAVADPERIVKEYAEIALRIVVAHPPTPPGS
jgi:AcrR family transcriptional regulator